MPPRSCSPTTVAALALALLAAACGGSPASAPVGEVTAGGTGAAAAAEPAANPREEVYAELEGLEGDAYRGRLVELAGIPEDLEAVTVDIEALLAEEDRWRGTYEELLRGASTAEG